MNPSQVTAALARPSSAPAPGTGWPTRAATRPRTRNRYDPSSLSAIYKDPEWTITFVCFLLYLVAITSFRLPIGEVAIASALAGMVLAPLRFRFPMFVFLSFVYLMWSLVGYQVTPYVDPVLEALEDGLKLALIALVVVNALKTTAQIRFFMIVMVVLFAIFPARGAIFNYALYGYTLKESGRAVWVHIYENPNDLAALTLLPLSLAAGLLIGDRNTWVRRGALASAFVFPIVILMTQSRGGFLALALFGVLTLAGHRKRFKSLLLVALLGVGVALAAPGGVWERMFNLASAAESGNLGSADDFNSAEQRTQIWSVAGTVIKQRPVVGVGLGAYRYAHYDMWLVNQQRYPMAGGTRDAHSTYLTLIAETGWPGLLLFIAIVGSVWLKAVRARRRWAAHFPKEARQLSFVVAGLFAFLVAGAFATFAQLAFLYIHLGVIYALTTSLEKRGRATHSRGQTHARDHRRGAGVSWPATRLTPAAAGSRLR